jgi:feruloyl esterase
MASRYGKHGEPDFERLQRFYRLFRGPGVGHCAGGVGPQPQNLFGALVDWVEKDMAPEQVLAQNASGGVVTRTRPLCPYPQTAIYKGSGSTDDAANFRCGGNLEKRRVVCADVLTKYKREVKGQLDFKGTGVDRDDCFRERDDHDDRKKHHRHDDDD